MEGRPPFDDPDDDLEFDFGSGQGRRERDSEQPPDAGDEEPPAREPASPEPPSPPPSPSEPGSSSEPEDPLESGEWRQIGLEHGSGTPPGGEPVPGSDDPSTGGGTGEDSLETGERPRRRERPRKRGLRIGKRRSARRERSTAAGAAAASAGTAAADTPAPSASAADPPLRDDPFTPAKVPVASTRRSRHRDLPANVRRRQAALAGGVVLVVLVGLILLISSLFGGGGDGDEDQPLGLKRLVGQTIISKLGKDGPDRDLLRRVRKGQVGGVIVNPRNEQTLTEQVDQLQQAASDGDNPELLVMIDQEGGDVRRLPGPPNTAAPDLGAAGADAARTEGEDTGEYLKGFGVNVDLAPVMDVALPTTADSIAERTFSDDAAVVSDVGSAFIEGLQSNDVAATAKHFPGLGPATINTDDSPATIAARDEELQAALQPFQAAVDAGVELVMVSSAIYPAYGPENPRDPNKPASSVKAIVDGLLRGQLGFEGLAITDDLQSVAIETLTTSSIAGVAALGAGCDLLLYAGSQQGAQDGFNAVLRAAKKQKLTRQRLQGVYDRITDLKSRLAEASS